MALLVKQTVKDWLRITTTTEDTLLDTICAQAEAMFLEQTDRIIEAADITEYRDGKGKTRMIVQYQPVNSVSALVINDVAIPARVVTTGTGYVLQKPMGLITLVGYIFSEGVQNIKVMYNAGYTTVPADITAALRDAAAYWYRGRERIGERSKSVGGGEVAAYMTADTPDMFNRIVDRYKRTMILER
jgi:hypothetical protein